MDNKSTGKFRNFIRSFGATRLLLQRAHENGFLIEGLVLYASLTDAFCRICLILKEQLEKNTIDINERYIYQDESKKDFIKERRIYKLAFEKQIINKQLFEELNALYDIRNKAIHRFFVSEIEYAHLQIVCNRYEKVYEELFRITAHLELEQIEKKIGMTIQGPESTENIRTTIYGDIAKKISSGSERNLAKTFNYTSVEEVTEFSSKHGLLKKCICSHAKVNHINLEYLKKINSCNLKDGLTKCSVKGCDCPQYIQKDDETNK